MRLPERAGSGCGIAVLVLLAGCVAVAWPAGSLLVPRNGGHPVGDPAWSWAFLGLLAAAFAAYAAATVAAARGRVPVRTALALAVAIQLAPLAAPLLLSTDAWTYWDYARIAVVHGGNPYVDVPAAFPLDPAFAYAGTRWQHTTSVYGPAFSLASEPLALVSGGSAAAAAWIYKVLAALGMVAAAGLAASRSRRPALALVLVGWSPLLAVHAAGAGHNDAWVAALLLGALAAAAAHRPAVAGAGWAVATLVKWVPVVLLPLEALATIARARAARASRRGDAAHLASTATQLLVAPVARRAAAGFAGATAVVVALAGWRYGHHWLDAFGPLVRNAGDETRFSFSHRLVQLGVPHGVAIALPLVVLGLVAVPLVRSALRGRARLGFAGLLVVACSPFLAPWYLLWATPLAAADDDGLAIVLSVVLSAYVLRQTIPL